MKFLANVIILLFVMLLPIGAFAEDPNTAREREFQESLKRSEEATKAAKKRQDYLESLTPAERDRFKQEEAAKQREEKIRTEIEERNKNRVVTETTPQPQPVPVRKDTRSSGTAFVVFFVIAIIGLVGVVSSKKPNTWSMTTFVFFIIFIGGFGGCVSSCNQSKDQDSSQGNTYVNPNSKFEPGNPDHQKYLRDIYNKQ